MSTIDMADLQRRVEDNVAALYAGEDLPHQFTEEESLALRPKRSPGFGVQPDGQIYHCGNALMGKSELGIALWNDEMRIEAGFSPENDSEEFRARVRADVPRRRNAHKEFFRQSQTIGSVRLIPSVPLAWYSSFTFRLTLLAITLIAAWWLLLR